MATTFDKLHALENARSKLTTQFFELINTLEYKSDLKNKLAHLIFRDIPRNPKHAFEQFKKHPPEGWELITDKPALLALISKIKTLVVATKKLLHDYEIPSLPKTHVPKPSEHKLPTFLESEDALFYSAMHQTTILIAITQECESKLKNDTEFAYTLYTEYPNRLRVGRQLGFLVEQFKNLTASIKNKDSSSNKLYYYNKLKEQYEYTRNVVLEICDKRLSTAQKTKIKRPWNDTSFTNKTVPPTTKRWEAEKDDHVNKCIFYINKKKDINQVPIGRLGHYIPNFGSSSNIKLNDGYKIVHNFGDWIGVAQKKSTAKTIVIPQVRIITVFIATVGIVLLSLIKYYNVPYEAANTMYNSVLNNETITIDSDGRATIPEHDGDEPIPSDLSNVDVLISILRGGGYITWFTQICLNMLTHLELQPETQGVAMLFLVGYPISGIIIPRIGPYVYWAMDRFVHEKSWHKILPLIAMTIQIALMAEIFITPGLLTFGAMHHTLGRPQTIEMFDNETNTTALFEYMPLSYKDSFNHIIQSTNMTLDPDTGQIRLNLAKNISSISKYLIRSYVPNMSHIVTEILNEVIPPDAQSTITTGLTAASGTGALWACGHTIATAGTAVVNPISFGISAVKCASMLGIFYTTTDSSSTTVTTET
jgi:hypothetical protein